MRSWLKDPELIKDTDSFMIFALYKSMAYDYDNANLDPIQKAVITYLMVLYHQICDHQLGFSEKAMADLKEISEKFCTKHGPLVVNDMCTIMANPNLVTEQLEYLKDLQ